MNAQLRHLIRIAVNEIKVNFTDEYLITFAEGKVSSTFASVLLPEVIVELHVTGRLRWLFDDVDALFRLKVMLNMATNIYANSNNREPFDILFPYLEELASSQQELHGNEFQLAFDAALICDANVLRTILQHYNLNSYTKFMYRRNVANFLWIFRFHQSKQWTDAIYVCVDYGLDLSMPITSDNNETIKDRIAEIDTKAAVVIDYIRSRHAAAVDVLCAAGLHLRIAEIVA